MKIKERILQIFYLGKWNKNNISVEIIKQQRLSTDYEVKTGLGPISLRGTAWAMLELAARVQVIWFWEFLSYFPVSLLITCFTHTGFANVLFGAIFWKLHHYNPLPFTMTRELFHNFLCILWLDLKIPYFLPFLGSSNKSWNTVWIFQARKKDAPNCGLFVCFFLIWCLSWFALVCRHCSDCLFYSRKRY